MEILEVGNTVFLIRFVPDNLRLVIGTYDTARKVSFSVLALRGGERVALEVPGANLDSWMYHAWYGNAIAVHPESASCYIAWDGTLHAFRTEDGRPLPVPEGVRANQVVLATDGTRLLAGYRGDPQCEVSAVAPGAKGGEVLWRKDFPKEFSQVAGFLPDGARFVTLDGKVRIRSFETGDELATCRFKPMGTQQPQLSSDGRHLGAIGYGSMYFFDLIGLGKPRKIGGNSNFGDFRSFAFHPDGKTVAVIHGGPTLVKIYDLETLARQHKFDWKLGPLQSVAYSPDGTLGAAGSIDGRIVVWDSGE